MTYLSWAANQVVTTAGDDIVWKFQVRDADGAVVDITGWSFSFWAVDQHDAANIVAVTNVDFSITSASTGKAQFTIAAATTDDQGGKVFRGCLWRTNTGANKELASGSWKVTRTVRQ